MKLRIICLLAVTLLLPACSNLPYRSAPPYRTDLDSSSPSPSASVTSVSLPDYQCQGEIPEPLQEKLKDYRLAQEEDFVTSIREYARESPVKLTCSIFTADFNGDGEKDYAMLLVNKKALEANSPENSPEKLEEKNAFRFELFVNRGNGNFGTAAVRSYKKPKASDRGLIYTSMKFNPEYKPEDENGSATRDNFTLTTETPEAEKKQKEPLAAIELWRSLPLTPDRQPQDLNVSTLASCSEVFYFVEEPREATPGEKSQAAEGEKSHITVEQKLKTANVCN